MSDKNQNIDDLIRDGFSSSGEEFDFGSWSQLEEKLDAPVSLDDSIKNAFDFAPENLPATTWTSIAENLDIDTVWKRIDKALTKRKRRRAIWWNAAAIGLLLTLAGYVFKDYIGESFYSSSNIDSKSIIESSELPKHIVNLNVDQEYFGPINESNIPAVDKDPYNQINNSSISNELVEVVEQTGSPSSGNNIGTHEIVELKRMPISDVQLLNISSSKMIIPNVEIEPVAENKEERRWTAGGILGVNNSFISDATWREGFSGESLTANNFSLSLSPGIFVQRELPNGLLIGSEFYFNSKSVRSTQRYDHFEYVNEKIELEYYKLTFNVNKVIASEAYPRLRGLVGAGVYYSYLKYGLEYKEGAIIGHAANHKNSDYGLDFNVGVQHSFGNLQMGLGMRSSLGLANIFLGTEEQSSDLNYSRTISNGFYLSIGYQF